MRPRLRGASGWQLFAALLFAGFVVLTVAAYVKAWAFSKESRRAEAEVRTVFADLVVREKESLAGRGAPVPLSDLGFQPPPGSAYQYSATFATIPTRRKIDVVLRAVRGGDGILRGDVWETDCEGKPVHVVDRSREATVAGVFRSWLGRSRRDAFVTGIATAAGAAADRKKRAPSTFAARRDQVRWIEFHSWDVESGCCWATGRDADLCCLGPLRILVDLQNRPHRIHTGAAETFPECPAALALALADEPESIRDPVPVAAAALASSDAARRGAGARLFARLRETLWLDPSRGFAALAPALSQADMALFGPAATAVAVVEGRARNLASGCRLADCSPELERRQIDEARPKLREVEAMIPAVRETAPKLVDRLVACAADATCADRVGAAWALSEAGRSGRRAGLALVSCLGGPADGPLRSTAARTLVKIGTDDDAVVAVVREAADKTAEEDVHAALLGVLVRFSSTRGFACGALADDAVKRIESVRNPSAGVLGHAGHACGEVAASLAPFVKSSRPLPRQESIRLLGLLGASGKPYLFEALTASDLPFYTRRDLERALARADEPDEP